MRPNLLFDVFLSYQSSSIYHSNNEDAVSISLSRWLVTLMVAQFPNIYVYNSLWLIINITKQIETHMS